MYALLHPEAEIVLITIYKCFQAHLKSEGNYPTFNAKRDPFERCGRQLRVGNIYPPP